MDSREKELSALSAQIADSLKGLPFDDGQERQITITVGGSNPGSIHVGSVVNINPAPQRPLELHEMDDHTLRVMRKNLTVKRNDAKRRCHLNGPSMMSLALILSAFFSALFNGYLLINKEPPIFILDEKVFFVLIGWAFLLSFFVKRLDKIRKIESIIINENQSIIDAIDVILRRRNS
ncbi:hypothetical protein J8655_02880 [Dickeya oryzae]|uniref:hypothetical protein n=1 Tax=Dickeya oryzae TaxID=1240404 RepID=UPI001AECD614|nr:hypothetical protein [Dickeya oryzae]MBP2844446.1 hypothetical protein [Dickeya oryzae]